jgi:hypothetical protein
MIGADRADDDSHCTLAAGDGRALAARRAELTVAGAILGRHHAMIDEDDAAAHRRLWRRLQRGDAVEADDLGLDPPRRRRARIAEGGEDQRLREGRDDLGMLLAAHPDRHVERLDMDVGEAQLGEPAHRPVARPRFGLGAGEALADLGGQPFEEIPGDRVGGERAIAQLGGVVADRLGGSKRGEGEGEGEEDQLFHGPRLATSRVTRKSRDTR